jgi:tRNA(Ile)-lysidine synthase
LAGAPAEIVRRVLQQALAVVGGDPYPPRRVRLERLIAALAAPGCAGRTLAGCRIVPMDAELLICREPAATAPMALEPDRWQVWDRRFAVRARQHCDAGSETPSLTVRALAADGWRQCRQRSDVLRRLPVPVRSGLPSVWQDERLLAVARLGPVDSAAAPLAVAFRFRPGRALAGAPFVGSIPFADREPYPWIAANHTFAST